MAAVSEIPDVIIIGGSHTGLSAALTLYRATHTSLIFDAGAPRNAVSEHVHMTPTWDHKSPNALREAARKELLDTGLVRFVPRRVVTAAKQPDGLFEVVDSEGEHWKGKKLLLAFGVREIFPAVEGFADLYGKLIFHCLFCLGYEKRGGAVSAVLADGPLADVTFATIFAQDAQKFTKRVKIYTNGNATLATELTGKISAGMEIDHRKLTRVSKKGEDLVVEFDEGPEDTLAFMTHQPEMPVDKTLPDQLGCEVVPKTGIKVNPPFNSTDVPGVFAAGDCCSGLRSVLTGMAQGSCAGVGIARELPPHDYPAL